MSSQNLAEEKVWVEYSARKALNGDSCANWCHHDKKELMKTSLK